MIAEGREIRNIILKTQPVASVIFTASTQTSLTVLYDLIMVDENRLLWNWNFNR